MRTTRTNTLCLLRGGKLQEEEKGREEEEDL